MKPGPAGTRSAGPELEIKRALVVVGALAVIGDVETLALVVRDRTQTDEDVDELEQDRRQDAADQRIVKPTALAWIMTCVAMS